MEGLRRSTGPISSRAVQQCSKRRRGPGRLVYKSTRLLQQSLVYKSRQSLPFVCRSTLLHPTTAQEGLKKSPRRRRAPTTSTSSDPKTIQCVAQRTFQRLMIRGLGKPSHPSAKSSSSKCAFSTVPEMRHPYVSVDQLQNFTEGWKRDVKSPLWCASPWGVITLLQHHGP